MLKILDLTRVNVEISVDLTRVPKQIFQMIVKSVIIFVKTSFKNNFTIHAIEYAKASEMDKTRFYAYIKVTSIQEDIYYRPKTKNKS